MNKPRVVMVTGGAGFIGKHLVHDLVKDGVKVIVFDALVEHVHRPGVQNGPPDWPDDLISLEVDSIENGDRQIICWFGDIRTPGEVHRALTEGLRAWGEPVSEIYHLAAEVSVGLAETCPAMFYSANVTGTASLLQGIDSFMAEVGGPYPSFFYASSMSVYGGSSDDSPIVLGLDQERPAGFYGHSKLLPEGILKLHHEKHRYPLRIGRYFNVFGHGQSPTNGYTGVAANFIARLLLGRCPVIFGDGSAKRTFVPVSHVVTATRQMMAPVSRRCDLIIKDVAGSFGPLEIRELASALCELPELSRRYHQLAGCDNGPPYPFFEPERRGDVRYAYVNAAQTSALHEILKYASELANDDAFVERLRAGGSGTLLTAQKNFEYIA